MHANMHKPKRLNLSRLHVNGKCVSARDRSVFRAVERTIKTCCDILKLLVPVPRFTTIAPLFSTQIGFVHVGECSASTQRVGLAPKLATIKSMRAPSLRAYLEK